MSNLSGLPPSALSRIATQTVALDIAVRVVNLPDALKNNTAPVKVQGVVTGQNPDGSVQVETDRGTIAVMLRDRQSLPTGQRLELEIPAGRMPQQATLRPAPATAPPPANSAPTTPPPTLAGQLAAALKLDRGATIKATEIDEALKAAATKLADLVAIKLPAAPLQAGQNLRLIPIPPGQVASVPLQSGQVGALPQEALLAALTTLIDSLPPQAQTLKADLTALLTRMSSGLPQPPQEEPTLIPPATIPGQPIDKEDILNTIRYEPTKPFSLTKPLDVQIAATFAAPLRAGVPQPMLPAQVQVIPTSGQTQPAPTPGLPPQVLPAQVVGFTTNNLPVLSLPLPDGGEQLYVAQFQTNNLKPGSPVLVTVLPQAQPLTPVTLPLSSWVQPGVWDSMGELMQAIHQVNPAIAHGLTQMLPSPAQPQNLGGLAMFFISVMRSGDLENLLQPQTMALLRQSGKGDILRAASGDLALAGRTETLALPQDWRAAILPFYHDQQVHKLPLYYKRMKDEDGDPDRDRRSKLLRFLFDLRLSRMGNVQIDGFMQPERLDMIMRTKAPLSVPMQRTMKGLYVNAMEKSNLHGELSFQFKPEHWVGIDVPAEMVDSVQIG